MQRRVVGRVVQGFLEQGGGLSSPLVAGGAACSSSAPSASSRCRRQHRQPPPPSSQWAAATAAASAAGLLAYGSTSRCETPTPASPSESKVTLIAKDRPGLLNSASRLLRELELDVKDAKISTEEDRDAQATIARHTYTVRSKKGESISESRLAEIAKSLEALGEAEAKPVPTFTRAEVAQHTTRENRIWVSYKDGVYDITDFIVNHPGGTDKIMLAAGKAIDPFWRIYQQHENRGTALNQLEKMRIGDLADFQPMEKGDDPYSTDPERHPGLIFHNNKPCNAELPIELMLDSWVTPNPVWFIRHHHPVPVVDPQKYRLQLGGQGAKPVQLTLEDLKTRFLKREVTTTIQCGGNRRSELDKVEKTSGIPWGPGAISTATWGGVYLREVLLHIAGLSLEGCMSPSCNLKHIVFHGLDDMQASIPIEKALNPYGDVMLAYEMNGEALPVEHGFPLRLVVPGVVGVRNVKWITRIEVSSEEAQGPWQRGIAYKGLSPSVKSLDGIDLEQVMSIQEMPVTSSIVMPKCGSSTELDDIEVKGWAWSGGGRGIIRVDVSVDDGKNWVTADLGEGKDQHPTRAWAWTFFEASVPVPEELKGKKITVLTRATDSSYNTQPERAETIWNMRGLNCNCWHRVQVQHIDD
eukprot:TRINITY_DN11345_c0_g1_i1.p1 TRINITY_DN11345_c0_g1~~TRINITY_DN11345_c0_g1_i1.p1  ORF type:complete len:639 (-),score=134.90 TRINITY_DN11345_c0_g1_i1:350-2266(-)